MEKYILFSFDDTVKESIKVAKMLEKYNLKGTFFFSIKGIGKKLNVDDIKWISECHEIGSHCLSHTDLTRLKRQNILSELLESKIALGKIIEKEISSLAYPYGKFNKDISTIAMRLGYKCARTTIPYSTSIDKNWYSLKVSLWADPNPYMYYFYDIGKLIRDFKLLRLIYNPVLLKKWFSIALYMLERILYTNHRLKFHLIIHPQFIDRRGEWGKLEEIFNFIESNKTFFNILTVEQYVEIIKKL